MALGFRQARGAVVVTLDADLQNDPADIPRLLAELDKGFGVVSGVRAERHDSWLRRVSSRIANAVRNWATDESITDVGCSLKAYRAEYLVALPMFTGMHRFLPTCRHSTCRKSSSRPARSTWDRCMTMVRGA